MSLHDPRHAVAPGTEPEQSADWQLVSLIDPAGQGGDLAYTQGLSDLGQPELLLWARPTEGLDPGVDWLLTHRERSRLLNRWAVELLAGQLQAGQEREERFDGGHTVARFRFGRSILVSPLQFPYLVPGSQVICAAWSLLRRAPERPPDPPGAAVARRMHRWIAAAEAVTLGWRLRSGSPDRPDRGDETVGAVEFGPFGGDRFGPMTRWVDARVSQVLAADPDVIAAFANRLLLAEDARCEDCLLEDLTRLATRSNRNSACREASRVAQHLGVTVTQSEELTESPFLRTALSDGLEVLLVAAVLADLATPSATASATGPWEWATNDHRVPGRLWLARPEIRRAARELLTPATPALLASAVEHAESALAEPEGRALERLLAGLQTTAAASAQPGKLLRRDQSRGLPRSVVAAADRLAGHLLTGLAVPTRFPDDSWELLRQSLRPLVPNWRMELRAEIP